MQRQSIVVLIKGEQVEAWGSLKEACKKHGWSYNTVSRKKLPTEWKGWRIYRCPFRELSSYLVVEKESEKKLMSIHKIDSLERLMNVLTEENFGRIALEFVNWMAIYITHIKGVRKCLPEETKSLKNWEIAKASFDWTDDGKTDFKGVKIEKDYER